MGDEETDALALLGPRAGGLRLACRLRVTGDMIVIKHGVRAPPPAEEEP
jgi:hypothetical protein